MKSAPYVNPSENKQAVDTGQKHGTGSISPGGGKEQSGGNAFPDSGKEQSGRQTFPDGGKEQSGGQTFPDGGKGQSGGNTFPDGKTHGFKKSFRTDKSQKERIVYQSQMLHYGLYAPNPQKSSFSAIPWHWHDEFEFGHIISGSIRYKTNHHEFILQEGDGIFINSGTLHSLHPLDPAADTALCTQFFDQSFLAGYPGSIYDVKYIAPVQEAKSLDAVPLYHTREKDAEFLEKIRQCEEISLKKEPFFELRIRNIFSGLWETVYSWAMEQNNSEKTYDTAEDGRIKQILSVIQERYGDRLTIADLAQTAHISERECYRIFRNILGITPGNFIEIIRLQKAQELLRYTDKSILEIALETGFGTSSYFCKMFKTYHHITPSQYRKL